MRSLRRAIGKPDLPSQRVPTIGALRTTEPVAPGSVASVAGYYSGWAARKSGPRGGGRFVHDPTDTTTADDGGSCIVSAGGARWRRVFESRTVYASDFGILADWNGTTGTDQTAQLQAVISGYFGNARGNLVFDSGRYRLDSARIDFRRVALIGDGIGGDGTLGGTELYIGNVGGFYTTIQDNTSPQHERFSIVSSSTRTANGQVALDLTGQNYLRLNNIAIYGAEVGIKIAKGTVVESHYGSFTHVNLSRCYRGLHIRDGIWCQTHSFFGGRFWDCVEAVVNDDDGAADINFFGTAFESDQALRHAATAVTAQTKWFSCRNESDVAPLVPAGQFTSIGTYWSGNRRSEALSVSPLGSSGALVESGAQVRTIGANNGVEFGAPNLLPNAAFALDPSASATSAASVPGWEPWGATHYATGKAAEGNYFRLERQLASGTIGLLSRRFTLKKGRYVVAFGWKKDGYGSGGTVSLDMRVGGVTFGAAGTYADLTFPFAYSASEMAINVNILQDIPDFQFGIQCNASTNDRFFYLYQPQLVAGQRGLISAPTSQPSRVNWGAAAPSDGYFVRGDIVYNTTPAAGGSLGWVCVTTGTPGTWKAFGAIAA